MVHFARNSIMNENIFFCFLKLAPDLEHLLISLFFWCYSSTMMMELESSELLAVNTDYWNLKSWTGCLYLVKSSLRSRKNCLKKKVKKMLVISPRGKWHFIVTMRLKKDLPTGDPCTAEKSALTTWAIKRQSTIETHLRVYYSLYMNKQLDTILASMW